MKNERKSTENTAETVTISRAEYEKLKSLKEQNAELSQQVQWLMEQMRLAKKRMFGTSSEKVRAEVEEQLSFLFKQTKGRMTRKKDTVGGKAGEYNPEGCDNPNISYNNLMEILSLLSEQLSANTEQIKADMVDWLTSLRKSIIEANTLFTEADLNKELQRKDRLLDSLLDGVISKADYSLKIESIENKINSIQEDIKKQEHKLADIGEIDRSLENIDEEVAKYLDDNQRLRLDFILQNLEQIEVFPDKVVVKIPVFGREVIINNVQFVSGQKRSRQNNHSQADFKPNKKGFRANKHIWVG